MNRRSLARTIDHTLLKPDATEVDVEQLCREAREYDCYSVCVNPCWVRTAAGLLSGSPVLVCGVAGFPLGANAASTKAREAERIAQDGGREVDMVINLGRLKGGDYATVEEDIRQVRDALGPQIILKVILETAALDQQQKKDATEIAVAAGADYVKTSTGFHPSGGASAEDVALLRDVAAGRAKVKASGGIRTLATALQMLEAGADRIGLSATVAILNQAPPE